jgi:hypothetical protein
VRRGTRRWRAWLLRQKRAPTSGAGQCTARRREFRKGPNAIRSCFQRLFEMRDISAENEKAEPERPGGGVVAVFFARTVRASRVARAIVSSVSRAGMPRDYPHVDDGHARYPQRLMEPETFLLLSVPRATFAGRVFFSSTVAVSPHNNCCSLPSLPERATHCRGKKAFLSRDRWVSFSVNGPNWLGSLSARTIFQAV